MRRHLATPGDVYSIVKERSQHPAAPPKRTTPLYGANCAKVREPTAEFAPPEVPLDHPRLAELAPHDGPLPRVQQPVAARGDEAVAGPLDERDRRLDRAVHVRIAHLRQRGE